MHRLRQLRIDQLAHVGHDRIGLHRQADRDSWLAIHEEAIRLWLRIGTLHGGNIANAQLLAIEGAEHQVLNVPLILDRLVHPQLYLVTPSLVGTGIDRLARILQSHHDLRRDHTVASDLLLRKGNVDHLVTIAHKVDSFHALHRQ